MAFDWCLESLWGPTWPCSVLLRTLSFLFEFSRAWQLSSSRHIPFCYLYVSKWAVSLLSLSAFPAELFTCLSYIFSFLHSVELTLFRSEYLPTFPFLLILGPNVCISSSSSAFLKDIVLVETKRSMCSVLIQSLPTFTPLSKVIPIMDKFSINLGLDYGWVIWLPFNVT